MRPSMLLALALVAAAAGGCAHAPARDDERCLTRMMVTGSRIPQWVDTRTGVPATSYPVRFYDAEDLRLAGRDGNLADAMRSVPPRLSTSVDRGAHPPPTSHCTEAPKGT